MAIKDLDARQVVLDVGGNKITAYSFHAPSLNGDCVVQLFGDGLTMSASAPSRGEALVALAMFLADLQRELRAIALEQEGAFEREGVIKR